MNLDVFSESWSIIACIFHTQKVALQITRMWRGLRVVFSVPSPCSFCTLVFLCSAVASVCHGSGLIILDPVHNYTEPKNCSGLEKRIIFIWSYLVLLTIWGVLLVFFIFFSKMILSFWFRFPPLFQHRVQVCLQLLSTLSISPFKLSNWEVIASHLHSGNVTGARKALDFARICSNVYRRLLLYGAWSFSCCWQRRRRQALRVRWRLQLENIFCCLCFWVSACLQLIKQTPTGEYLYSPSSTTFPLCQHHGWRFAASQAVLKCDFFVRDKASPVVDGVFRLKGPITRQACSEAGGQVLPRMRHGRLAAW